MIDACVGCEMLYGCLDSFEAHTPFTKIFRVHSNAFQESNGVREGCRETLGILINVCDEGGEIDINGHRPGIFTAGRHRGGFAGFKKECL